MEIAIVIAIVIVIVIQLIYANFMSKAAIRKGYDKTAHAWALCFWLGIFGGLYVIALPDLVNQNQNKQIIELLSKEKNDSNVVSPTSEKSESETKPVEKNFLSQEEYEKKRKELYAGANDFLKDLKK